MLRLFGTAGIRGPYLESVTPELAYRIGLAVASYIGGRGSSCVGHDVRTTSPLLAYMAAAGLMAGGVDSIYLGLVATPVVAYSVPHTRSSSGIVITASHNPPQDNGIKVFDRSGMEYTMAMEEDLEKIIFEGDAERMHAPWDRVGRLVFAPEIQEDYIRDLVSVMHVSRPKLSLKIAVDCANGAASGVTPRILRSIGVERVISVNCHQDGFFPGRYPEPRPDVLYEYQKILGPMNLHGLLAHDGDADRLSMIVPGWGFVKQDLLIALYAAWKLRESRGDIIVSVDVGMEVEEIAEKLGGKIVRAKLGKQHEKLKELGSRAVLAAEPWKLIDPSWGPWVDGIYQAALIARISLETGLRPIDIVKALPFYPSARLSIKFSNDRDKKVVYQKSRSELLEKLATESANILDIDGVRVQMEDGSWILLRASGTEPKVRIYAQSREPKRLIEMVERAKAIVLGKAKSLEARVLGIEEYVDDRPPRQGSLESIF